MGFALQQHSLFYPQLPEPVSISVESQFVDMNWEELARLESSRHTSHSRAEDIASLHGPSCTVRVLTCFRGVRGRSLLVWSPADTQMLVRRFFIPCARECFHNKSMLYILSEQEK